MGKKRFSTKTVVLTAMLSIVFTLGAVVLAAWLLLGSSGLSVLAGTAVIRTQFVGEYDEDAAADAALDAMVDALGDRWSYYLDAEGYAALQERRSNSYVGIGVTVSYAEDGVHIEKVTEGGPAETAGLLPGEIIIAADGHDLTGTNTDASSYIQGEEGTQVRLSILDASGTEREVTVTRARIPEDPASSEMLEGSIGYVALKNFYQGSADHVIAAVDDLLAQGAESLIFDMRNNPGGYLTELTQILDHLLPEGAVYQSGNRNGPTKTVRSDAQCVDVPMVVLVNEDSYSAAELFAAQLRESVGAPIVGQPTCGKGYSQQTFVLPGGRALNISTKTYYTGSGQSLIGVGIQPDEAVELTDTEDTQLAAAVALLKK